MSSLPGHKILLNCGFIKKFNIQFSSVTQLCPILCDPMNRSTPGVPVLIKSLSSPKLLSIKLVMPSSHLILCRPLLLLPPTPPSIRVFSNESALHIRWPKYWRVQGTLKSLLQHHISKASILQHSAFFTVQLSHPYMTTGKTIALTRRTFVGKVMCLLLNMLSGLVITFLQGVSIF